MDMGGLTKEWFLLLVRKIFRQEYGMFNYNKKAGVFWFSPSSMDNLQEFYLTGVIMGLAIYNGVILDIRFPAICYRKLLSPAIVPRSPSDPVGVCQGVGLNEIKEIEPELAEGLNQLLVYEGNVEEDFSTTFQVSVTDLGILKTTELKEGGCDIPVTNENRDEFVKLYADWLLNKSIFEQFQSFYKGFHSVCASNALLLLKATEIEMLICGCPDIDFKQLKRCVKLEGYTKNDKTIRLPIAYTCFNEMFLPAYQDQRQLKRKLLIAIENAEGFGIE